MANLSAISEIHLPIPPRVDAALDPMGRGDMLQVMERLRQHTTIFYSTHLLDDVQRVSDTVVIMNHGRLVAQAPIAELLAGNNTAIYALTIRAHDQIAFAQERGVA